MERKRVFEIKKRFEELDKNTSLTNGNASVCKSPAFQVKKYNKAYSKLWGNEEPVQKTEFNSNQVVFKKAVDCHSLNSESSSGKSLIKRSHAFRSSKNDYSVSKPKIGSNQVKNEWESPLPKGPAPKKPPRTFAHRAGDELHSPSLPSVQRELPKPPSAKTFKRSKTEPLIMLKKIESALNSHRANGNGRREPPSSNGNIYEEPCDVRRPGRSLPASSPVRSPPEPEPVYSEPLRVKTQTRALPQAQCSKSLYYMSTPIFDGNGNPRQPKNPNYEETLKKIQMLVLPDSPRAEADSDAESVKEIKPEVVEERKIYAKRVSSLRERSAALKEFRSNKLMDALLLVGIDNDVKNGKVAYIKEKFPADASIPQCIECLIFPDADNWPPSVHPPLHIASLAGHNNYCVTLTSEEGARSYAYCRRLQPEGSSVCLPLAYAILSSHKANSFYYKILEEIENNHGFAKQRFADVVRDLYNTQFPNECQSIRVGGTTIKRCLDPRVEDMEISKLLKAVRVPNFLKLLSNTLMEKKIIFVSSFISLLSDSIEGLLKAIYPFDWQYNIITVVPSAMPDFLDSPAPYIFGILKTENSPVESLFSNIGDAFVIDVDRGEILVENVRSKEEPVIPHKLFKSLRESLYLMPVNCTDSGPSEALVRLFVQLVGHYRNHLYSRCDSYPHHFREFQTEDFIKAPSSKGIRQFLESFCEQGMFKSFIEEKKMNPNRPESILFDQRCAEYLQELANKKNTTLNKAVKNIGDRIKDWTS